MVVVNPLTDPWLNIVISHNIAKNILFPWLMFLFCLFMHSLAFLTTSEPSNNKSNFIYIKGLRILEAQQTESDSEFILALVSSRGRQMRSYTITSYTVLKYTVKTIKTMWNRTKFCEKESPAHCAYLHTLYQVSKVPVLWYRGTTTSKCSQCCSSSWLTQLGPSWTSTQLHFLSLL